MPRKLADAAFSNAYLLLTLAALFWGGNAVLARAVHGHVPPIAMACIRWWVAFAIVLPFALPYLRRDWAAIAGNLPMMIFLSVFGVGCYSTFLYIGLNYTTAINAAVIPSSGPVLIALVCFFVFGDRLRPLQILGIAVSLLGVLAIIARGEIEALASLAFNQGDLWVLGAVLTWAVYTAFVRKRPDIHGLSFAVATFAIGSAAITPLFVAEHLSGWKLQLDAVTVLTLVYVSIFPSILSYLFFNRGVDLIGGARAGVFMHMVPLFGTALAIVFLGEALHLYHVLGFALILLGVTMTARGPRPLSASRER